MIKVLIIEDEKAAANRLEKLLLNAEPSAEIIGRMESITASVNWLKSNPAPDLILLDIQLSDGQSFEIFRQVNVDSFVIFTTAYDEYAIKAFELNSIDYLLKPIDSTKLSHSLQKYRKLSSSGPVMNRDEIIALLSGQQKIYKKRFLVNAGTRIRSVEMAEIAWFVSTDKSTFLCSSDNVWYPVEFSLDHLADILDPDEFFRINRKYMISFRAIDKIHVLSKSRILVMIRPSSNEEIYVSAARTHEFRRWLDR